MISRAYSFVAIFYLLAPNVYNEVRVIAANAVTFMSNEMQGPHTLQSARPRDDETNYTSTGFLAGRFDKNGLQFAIQLQTDFLYPGIAKLSEEG